MLAAERQTIYMYLLDEGTDVWRPVQAIKVSGEDLYFILRPPDFSELEEIEVWQFPPGSIVRCEEKVLTTERVLVAIAVEPILPKLNDSNPPTPQLPSAEPQPMRVSFGGLERDVLELTITDYERDPAPDQYEDNDWLRVQVAVSSGTFHGYVETALLTTEVNALLLQLRSLYGTLSGTVEFSTVEGQLRLTFLGDGRGHIRLNGEVADSAGNRISFTLDFDQSQLRQSIHQLEMATSVFPVRIA